MAPFLRAGTSNVSRRPRLAWAQSRTFERCAPATPQHDPPRALAPPRRAHCPCTAHISALDRIHGRTVWGGCTGGGLACGSLAIHTHHKIPHNSVVHFCLLCAHVSTLGRSRRTFILRLAHDQGRVGDRVFRWHLLPGDCRLHELDRVPLMWSPPSNSNSNLPNSCVPLPAPPIPPAPR